MQVGQRAIRLLLDQRREGGQVGGQDRPGAVALGSRGDFPRFAPALFEPPHTQEALTWYVAATAAADTPASLSSKTRSRRSME